MALNSNPKKALRGLFAKTEPTEPEAITEVVKVNEIVTAEKVVEVTEANDVNGNTFNGGFSEVSPVDVPTIEREPSKVSEVFSSSPIKGFLAKAATQKRHDVKREPFASAEVAQAIQPPPAFEVSTDEGSQMKHESVSNVSEEKLHEGLVVDVASHQRTAQAAERAYAVERLQYNFENQASVRKEWVKGDYLSFLRRIDASQTEAFFLKGKLLEEVKARFFENNRMGWGAFCDNELNMSYTTANQYINVAKEFDVASHQRTDFGFEHFKALLPLSPESRKELVEKLPTISVKALRALVQERTKATSSRSGARSFDARSFVANLLRLKGELAQCSEGSLDQATRWQVSAACRDISEELRRFALVLEGRTDVRVGAVAQGSSSYVSVSLDDQDAKEVDFS